MTEPTLTKSCPFECSHCGANYLGIECAGKDVRSAYLEACAEVIAEMYEVMVKSYLRLFQKRLDPASLLRTEAEALHEKIDKWRYDLHKLADTCSRTADELGNKPIWEIVNV